MTTLVARSSTGMGDCRGSGWGKFDGEGSDPEDFRRRGGALNPRVTGKTLDVGSGVPAIAPPETDHRFASAKT